MAQVKLAQDYEDVFRRMVEDIAGSAIADQELIAFWPQIGPDFVCEKSWLYVGQAAYGWETEDDDSPVFGGGKAPDIGAMREFSEWVDEGEDNALAWAENQVATSVFWKAVRWLQTESEDAWEPGWTRSIAWSDLCKIAPRARGNPGSILRQVQRDECERLLRIEIQSLQPKAIVFLTGASWLADFRLTPWEDLVPALVDPSRIVPTTVESVPAAVAPHPRTAFKLGMDLDALGQAILAAIPGG